MFWTKLPGLDLQPLEAHGKGIQRVSDLVGNGCGGPTQIRRPLAPWKAASRIFWSWFRSV